jgi:hypothetical protein
MMTKGDPRVAFFMSAARVLLRCSEILEVDPGCASWGWMRSTVRIDAAMRLNCMKIRLGVGASL